MHDQALTYSNEGRPVTSRRSRRRGIFSMSTLIQYALLIILVFLTFFIILVMFSMSFRPTVLIYADFWRLLPWPPIFSNYQVSIASLIQPMLRTMLVTVASILGILALSCPAAYAFARMRFAGKNVLFYLILAVLMIPGIILLTPNFVLANQLNLRGSLFGLILFYIGGGLPFAIFLITTFFRSQPEEIFGAARVDGGSELQILWHICLPLAMPILVTISILNFMGFYGDFIWPSLVLPRSSQTLMMALQDFNPVVSEFATRPDLGAQTAGYVVAIIPQLFLFIFAMKYFIQGVLSSSIKG